MLWLDRQSRAATGRGPLRAQVHAAQAAQVWSPSNRRRWIELDESGLLTAAGLAAAPTDLRPRSPTCHPELPDYIAAAFQAEPRAWRHFQALARTHRRQFVGWIHTAKRPSTREKRIRESIAVLSAGRKLGLK